MSTRRQELEVSRDAYEEKFAQIRGDLDKCGILSPTTKRLLENEAQRLCIRLAIVQRELDIMNREPPPVDCSGHDEPYVTVCEGAE